MSERRSRESKQAYLVPSPSCLTDQAVCVYHYSSRTIDRSFVYTRIIECISCLPFRPTSPHHATPRICQKRKGDKTLTTTLRNNNHKPHGNDQDNKNKPHQRRHPVRLNSLCKLLLDKEGPQVRQLPGARHAQHGQLDQDPAHHAAVGALGLVAELGLAFLFFRTYAVSIVSGGGGESEIGGLTR